MAWAKQAVPRLLIVGGQQRLTSLFAVMTNSAVVRDDYTEGRMRIAFRPTDGAFAVNDAAIEQDPEFIADISALWSGAGRRAFSKLADHGYPPAYPAPGWPAVAKATSRAHYGVSVVDLLDAGLLAAGAVLINPADDAEATVTVDGRVEFDGTLYESPSGASDTAHGGSTTPVAPNSRPRSVRSGAGP